MAGAGVAAGAGAGVCAVAPAGCLLLHPASAASRAIASQRVFIATLLESGAATIAARGKELQAARDETCNRVIVAIFSTDAQLLHTDWPDRLWVVRHGQSAGNVARDAAELAGDELIDIETRDADTPLSALGQQQARALGTWFAELPAAQRPNVFMTSPFIRSQQTCRAVADALGFVVHRERARPHRAHHAGRHPHGLRPAEGVRLRHGAPKARATVTAAARSAARARLRAGRRHGLPVRVRCSEACSVLAQVVASKSVAAALGVSGSAARS